MRTQFKLIDRRKRRATEILTRVGDVYDHIRKQFYRGFVDYVILYSPVDTGTYMSAHEIRVGRTGAAPWASSHKKPRRQAKQPFAEEAQSRLYHEIDNLPPMTGAVFVGNGAVHAKFVEYGKMGGTEDTGEDVQSQGGYFVYTRARAMTAEIVQSAVAEVRSWPI